MSNVTANSPLSELMNRLVSRATSYGGGNPQGLDRDSVAALLSGYYRHASLEDLADRDENDLYGAVAHHLKIAVRRSAGVAAVNVLTPTVEANSWAADGRTVIEIVTDDMPFLVDSVTMALERERYGVHRVLHPQFTVVRDAEGTLTRVVGSRRSDGDPDASGETLRESWIHVEIDRVFEDEFATITARLEGVLDDVRVAVEDWQPMHARLAAAVESLAGDPPPLEDDEIREGIAFLTWLGEDHFTFLGSREYRLVRDGDDETLVAVPGTGLGLLRQDPSMPRVLPGPVAAKARDKTLLVLAKANSRSTVHRPVYLDYVGIKTFNAAGEVDGERRFLGLFSSAAYTESVTRIPLLREKVEAVMGAVGFEPHSHDGKALLDVLETYPRDELFQTPAADLVPIATSVVHIRERRQLRLFVRRDVYSRFWSVLVYLPRDRYNTTVRERIASVLQEQLGGDSVEFTARVGDSFTARLHFVVRPQEGVDIVQPDVADLEARCVEAARSWEDDFAAAMVKDHGEGDGSMLVRRYTPSFPEAYKEDYAPSTGAVDIARFENIRGTEGLALSLYEPVDAAPGTGRLKIYRIGGPLSLSEMLPILTSMGVDVVDEWPYELEGLPRETHLYDFGLRFDGPLPGNARELFQDAFMSVWEGRNESDGFNALVLAAGLGWREAVLLRAYARYMRQGGSPFSQLTIEEALRANLEITRLLIDVFAARLDPEGHDEVRATDLEAQVLEALDEVRSLDQDRILRGYLIAIKATLRTNFFQRELDDQPHAYVSLKLDPSAIPDLPLPRPKYEIFVYSPRVEGVHLRFGAVARGGLRWSDRRDDFRAEVLGLVKAQMVKNTVIVPVGAKGGFYAKQLPDPSDRDAWLAEGVACYRTFIRGLLDITDNLVDGEVVPPREVVRHDGDDPYLVVAADKGTASFSDIANSVSAEYGFWLGDAFASGGSVGYDHKGMGITARGAWLSVRRHFREMGIDCQAEDFTCVGIGDMSGDVFGNGMLRSEHTRMIAAFDHRDIFLDPDPDPVASFTERRRLFDLPRSSWQDYDRDLISAGGGVYPRSAKSVPITPEVRAALALPEETAQLTPAELIRAILLAPVDLLWNGGIGTYVKGSNETHADVADKANDAIRVDGSELRVRCVGEGGNLGFTQAGRIEYARQGQGGLGGRINADFIDNSAGVDTSDHEVNIKILLDHVVAAGQMTYQQRNQLLASMTDEVGELVLTDNYEQNLALADVASEAASMLPVHEDWMRTLERRGILDRELEGLPSRKEVAARVERREGLSMPELAVLLAYTKIALADDLLETDLADDPFLRSELISYFPSTMRQDYRTQMTAHRLHREIIITQVVNRLVNNAGISYWHRLTAETSTSAPELTRANFLASEIYGGLVLKRQICDLDNQIDAGIQTRMRLEVRTLLERVSRWLVTNRRHPLDSEAILDQFGVTVQKVVGELPGVLVGRELADFEDRRTLLLDHAVPEAFASAVAVCAPAYAVLGIAQTAGRVDVEPLDVARIHFLVGEHLGLSRLMRRILELPRGDRWQTMARVALRDDLDGVHAQLTEQLVRANDDLTEAEAIVTGWVQQQNHVVERAAATFEEIYSDEQADLARMSVALRVARSLLTG